MRKSMALIVAGSLLVTGCTAPFTEAPVATNFEATEQRKLQSAYHWQVIADDAARQLLQQLESTLCTPNQPVCTRGLHEGKKLYIRPQETDNQFHRAFRTSLMSALIKANVFRITKNPYDKDVLVINVDTEYVRWADRARRDPVMGEMTTLTSGLWVLRNAYRNISPGTAMVGAAVSADVYFAANAKYAKGPRPKHELMVSVTAADQQYFYANVTNVYYTTERDFYSLYAHKQPPPNLPKLPYTKVRVVE